MVSSYPSSSCRKECISELLGTYLLVVLGPTSVIIVSLISNANAILSLIFAAFSFGGTVALVILLFGRHSGAVINPVLLFLLFSIRLLVLGF